MASSLANYFKNRNRDKEKDDTTPLHQKETAEPSPSTETSTGRTGSGSALADYFKKQRDERLGVKKYSGQDEAYQGWANDVFGLSEQLTRDYQSRDGKFQPRDTFRTYRDTTYTTISDLLKKGYDMREFYTQKGPEYDSGYGADASKKILDNIQKNINYLTQARAAIRDEGLMWDSFENEDQWNTAKRYAHYSSIPQAEDFEEKSAYKTTKNGKKTKQAFSGVYTETGYDDLLYDYINGSKEARERQAAVDATIAPGSLYTDTHSGWDDLPEEVVKTFNYLYATEGKEAAYDYINTVADQGITGINAAALKFANSTGAFSMSALAEKGLNLVSGKGDEPSAFYGDIQRDLARAQEQHPVASAVGSVGGNIALMYGVGKGVQALGSAIGAMATGTGLATSTATTAAGAGLTLTPAVKSIMSSAATFLATDAIQNAGNAAAGYMSVGDYAKSVITSGLRGAAGGAAGNIVGSKIGEVLQKNGLMTPFRLRYPRQIEGKYLSKHSCQPHFQKKGWKTLDSSHVFPGFPTFHKRLFPFLLT